MKTFTCLALVFLAVTRTAVAGPEQIVKERAKQVRERNNESQGVPSQPNTPPPAAPVPAARPASSSTKPSPVAKIRADIAAWENPKAVTEDSKKQFTADVLAAVRGSKSPATATVNQLGGKLSAAVAGKSLGGTELSRLADNLNLAVNSASLSDERTEEIAAQVQADLEKSGVEPAVASDVADSLRGVMAGLKE